VPRARLLHCTAEPISPLVESASDERPSAHELAYKKSPGERELADEKGNARGWEGSKRERVYSERERVYSESCSVASAVVSGVPASRSGFVLEAKQLEAKLSVLALGQQDVFGVSDAEDNGRGSIGERTSEDGLPRNSAVWDSDTPVDTRTRSESHAAALSTTVRLAGLGFRA
jgi:hypothetical protein